MTANRDFANHESTSFSQIIIMACLVPLSGVPFPFHPVLLRQGTTVFLYSRYLIPCKIKEERKKLKNNQQIVGEQEVKANHENQ
jgi:hypothetical protein